MNGNHCEIKIEKDSNNNEQILPLSFISSLVLGMSSFNGGVSLWIIISKFLCMREKLITQFMEQCDKMFYGLENNMWVQL